MSKHMIINVVTTVGVGLIAFSLSKTDNKKTASTSFSEGYTQGYNESTQCFHEWLLDVGYAEYDKRTGAWKLTSATDIQGALIEPSRRLAYVNIEDHIKSLEDELVLARKQFVAQNKHKPASVDFKKM